MKKTVNVLLITAILGLTACASMPFAGGASAEKFQRGYLQQNLIEGKTTKAEVAAKYGKPVSKDIHGRGSETWVYNSSRSGSVLGALNSSSSATVNTGLGIIKSRLLNAIPGGGYGEVGAMVNSAKHDTVNKVMGQNDQSAILVIIFNTNGVIKNYSVGVNK